MPWMGSTTVSTAVPLAAMSGADFVVGPLFDKMCLKPDFAERGKIGIDGRRFRLKTRRANPNFLHLGAGYLVQRTGDALHARAAVHAVDLKG
jgi:hypothetical protein